MARLITIFAVLVAALLAPSACAGKPKGGPHPHQGLSKFEVLAAVAIPCSCSKYQTPFHLFHCFGCFMCSVQHKVLHLGDTFLLCMFVDLLAAHTQPYKPGKPDITLSAKELQQLRDGKLVQQSLTVGDGQGRALAVQDVHAPPEYVWDRILDFENYPKMVPKVSKCGNYEVENLRNGTDILKTRMVMNVFGVKFDNYILHKHYKSLDSLTWTLDYSRRSTL
eukprot:16641-Heterococcus_DN1.PRE.1